MPCIIAYGSGLGRSLWSSLKAVNVAGRQPQHRARGTGTANDPGPVLPGEPSLSEGLIAARNHIESVHWIAAHGGRRPGQLVIASWMLSRSSKVN